MGRIHQSIGSLTLNSLVVNLYRTTDDQTGVCRYEAVTRGEFTLRASGATLPEAIDELLTTLQHDAAQTDPRR